MTTMMTIATPARRRSSRSPPRSSGSKRLPYRSSPTSSIFSAQALRQPPPFNNPPLQTISSIYLDPPPPLRHNLLKRTSPLPLSIFLDPPQHLLQNPKPTRKMSSTKTGSLSCSNLNPTNQLAGWSFFAKHEIQMLSISRITLLLLQFLHILRKIRNQQAAMSFLQTTLGW